MRGTRSCTSEVGTGAPAKLRPKSACAKSNACSRWCHDWITSAAVHHTRARPAILGAQGKEAAAYRATTIVQPCRVDEPGPEQAKYDKCPGAGVPRLVDLKERVLPSERS